MTLICSSDDVQEGQAKGVTLNGINLFLVRKYGRLYGYKNACPHLGIALEWMPDQFLDSECELIQCSTHGALFDIASGLCVSGPCVDQYLQTIPVEERDNQIFLSE